MDSSKFQGNTIDHYIVSINNSDNSDIMTILNKSDLPANALLYVIDKSSKENDIYQYITDANSYAYAIINPEVISDAIIDKKIKQKIDLAENTISTKVSVKIAPINTDIKTIKSTIGISGASTYNSNLISDIKKIQSIVGINNSGQSGQSGQHISYDSELITDVQYLLSITEQLATRIKKIEDSYVKSVNGKTGIATIDTGVTTFNGKKGDIIYIAPVISVNGQTGDVIVHGASGASGTAGQTSTQGITG